MRTARPPRRDASDGGHAQQLRRHHRAPRAKDTSLERSLDLLDEGIALGSRAVELVDSFDLSPEEAEQLAEAVEADAAEGEGAACGTTAGAPEAGPAPEDTE